MDTNWAPRVNEDPRAAAPEPPAAGLAQVFLARSDSLRRIVAGMGFAPADADDILQDVYLEASGSAGWYQSPDQVARWLTRVTVNRCLLEYRRRKRFTRTASQVLRDQGTVERGLLSADQQAVRSEQLDAVRRAMQDLDESLLAPLALRYFSGMDATEISQVLNLPASTVRSRLRDARLILARRLRGFEP